MVLEEFKLNVWFSYHCNGHKVESYCMWWIMWRVPWRVK